jgi:hypothetical protein
VLRARNRGVGRKFDPAHFQVKIYVRPNEQR